MINTRATLKEYIKADMIANHADGFFRQLRIIPRYLRRLRKTEYLVNLHKSKFVILISKFLLRRLSVKTGISIGLNSFGKGLYLPHYGLVIVNDSARFGDDCVVQCGVNISENASGGNHIYFGAGCKVMKNTFLPNDTICGANCVVTKVFEKENCVLAGIPATVISENGFRNRCEKI